MKIYRAALPLAWLYGAGVWVRNRLVDIGILPSKRFTVPVISVGNLTVGGTGKTPHTEYLVRLLREDFAVSVLSRGYKRKSKGFYLADPYLEMEEAGDEAFQVAHKFPEIYVAVDKNRCHGIQCLINGSILPPSGVVLLDDAYQHRYVKPGLSLLLTDYHRPFYDDVLLPAGRLREPVCEKRRADIFIVTKCPDNLGTAEKEEIRRRIDPQKGQEVYFTRMVYGKLQPLFAKKPERELDSLRYQSVLLLTGIASPEPLKKKISSYTLVVFPLAFADHHAFTASDMRQIEEQFQNMPGKDRLIITTEKDASRLLGNPHLPDALKPFIYVLPIEVEFLDSEEEESFNHKIISYVRENTGNSSLSEE